MLAFEILKQNVKKIKENAAKKIKEDREKNPDKFWWSNH